jgi:hypothetical protein
LSSQRTTTHRKPTAMLSGPPSGHSFDFTRAIPQRQIRVSPGLRGDFAKIRHDAARDKISRPFREGLAGRPLRISPLARPFPCRLVEPYRLVSRSPNRPPATPLTTLRAVLRCGYPSPMAWWDAAHSQPTRPAVSCSNPCRGDHGPCAGSQKCPGASRAERASASRHKAGAGR